ncbi:MAG TPA: diacylglycerol kinase family protein [Puia sp.]|nr:diacylglycerol kinase family protein [Puia sp.]
MARKIIYLINPISGTKGKTSLRELIADRTAAQGIPFEILPTDAEGRYDHLLPLIENGGVTDVVICGGDGTVSAVAAALKRSAARIGIIPMGSGNGLALAAGIPTDPARALDIIFAAKAAFIDGLHINGQFSCMLCGIGLDGKVAHEFARQDRRGLQTYIRVTMKNFFTAHPHPFRLHVPRSDGGQTVLDVMAFFISIANANQFGNNFTIAPRASLQDGLLDIVVARKTNRLRFLLAVLRQVLGGYRVAPVPGRNDSAKIPYFQTPALVIENPGGAPLHIDGDPRNSSGTFRIEVDPRAILLIQP